MKYVVCDYPGCYFSFRIKKQLETDQQRTQYLQKYLKRHKIDIPNHDPEDMVVELSILKDPKVELWILGS